MTDGLKRWVARVRKSLPRLLAGLLVTVVLLAQVSGRLSIPLIDRL